MLKQEIYPLSIIDLGKLMQALNKVNAKNKDVVFNPKIKDMLNNLFISATTIAAGNIDNVKFSHSISFFLF